MPSFEKFIFADKEKPTITCPLSMEVNTDEGSATATVTLEATAEDNVDESVPVSSDAPSDGAYNVGTRIVKFTATDKAQNSETCTVTVTVSGKFYLANILIQILYIKRHFLSHVPFINVLSVLSC